MALFDNMKGKLSQASSSTVQKSKELLEITRLNGLISEAEAQISELYGRIGYEIYCVYHESPIPEVAELMGQITETHEKIQAWKEQIQAINNANTCPQCHAKINKGMTFCSACGYRLISEEKTEPQAQATFCSNCGAPIPEGSIFCMSCGKKLDEQS